MELTMTVDATDQALEREIAAARDALLKTAVKLAADGAEWWTARELKERARNGWSSAAMGLALRQLVDDGTLEQGRDFRVRLHP